ncbi:hypothetical protein RCL_jg3285.t1 [Rhizophagus clarus]|uniref:Uncharacterized protein n=1 Tax=Rhizophagus clarus TaxID=94130 RepID=A0A8H3M755_9GLOM|nr:hypothetical protein RCL_jg3285.t1 [Rhizophagus clarus]
MKESYERLPPNRKTDQTFPSTIGLKHVESYKGNPTKTLNKTFTTPVFVIWSIKNIGLFLSYIEFTSRDLMSQTRET